MTVTYKVEISRLHSTRSSFRSARDDKLSVDDGMRRGDYSKLR
ncbi:hypothetical protein ACFL08_05285 [Patescibacteria group bacterium]